MNDSIAALLYLLFYEDQQANPMPKEQANTMLNTISLLLSSQKGEP